MSEYNAKIVEKNGITLSQTLAHVDPFKHTQNGHMNHNLKNSWRRKIIFENACSEEIIQLYYWNLFVKMFLLLHHKM